MVQNKGISAWLNEAFYRYFERGKHQAAKREVEESATSEKLVLTMDIQSVILCPKTLASRMYYEQKLQIHKLCEINFVCVV